MNWVPSSKIKESTRTSFILSLRNCRKSTSKETKDLISLRKRLDLSLSRNLPGPFILSITPSSKSNHLTSSRMRMLSTSLIQEDVRGILKLSSPRHQGTISENHRSAWEIQLTSSREWTHANSEQTQTKLWASFKTSSLTLDSTSWNTRWMG